MLNKGRRTFGFGCYILRSNKTYHIVYNWILKLISYILSTIVYLPFYIISNENVDIKL
jgi:cellobiose-specific phosphotransferase system component IIC